MQAMHAKRPQGIESENDKLKRLLTEAHLDIHALKGAFGVKHLPRKPDAQQQLPGCSLSIAFSSTAHGASRCSPANLLPQFTFDR
ncbi:MAG: hypothetical protein RSG22_09415 [Comamonas sp.]